MVLPPELGAETAFRFPGEAGEDAGLGWRAAATVVAQFQAVAGGNRQRPQCPSPQGIELFERTPADDRKPPFQPLCRRRDQCAQIIGNRHGIGGPCGRHQRAIEIEKQRERGKRRHGGGAP